MMYGYPFGTCSNWSFGFIGPILNVLIAVIIIVVIVKIIRRSRDRDWKFWNNSAENLLKERFVKGEITKEEYEEKLKVIRG